MVASVTGLVTSASGLVALVAGVVPFLTRMVANLTGLVALICGVVTLLAGNITFAAFDEVPLSRTWSRPELYSDEGYRIRTSSLAGWLYTFSSPVRSHRRWANAARSAAQ